MKNIHKGTLAVLGSMLLLLGSCQQGAKKEESNEPTTSEPVQAEPVAPPKGIISLEESKSLYDNYTKNRVDMIERMELSQYPDEKFEATRFTSFNYSDIKQYIAYIEQEAAEANVDISSLRLYFANYPNTPNFPNGQKVVHPRQNSIFIVPTTKVDGADYGFYIGADGNAKLIKDAVGSTETGATEQKNKSYASLVPVSLQDDTSLILNKGNSSPPPNGDY
jgi:hypothetical protein